MIDTMRYPAVLLLAVATSAPVLAEPVKSPVDFERHVTPLLGKLGCSAGSCHGSFQGRGGLRLSLFGYEPERDYLALTRDAAGRRVNAADPDRSLVLLKASGQVSHGGGKRIDAGSWAYGVLREWVADGCRREPGSGRIEDLRVTPEERVLSPGETARLRVEARFADGSTADVTPFCDFRVKDDSVAEVTSSGEARGLRAGDTAVVVGYRGGVASARLFVPYPAKKDFSYPRIPENNLIDWLVFAKLRRLNVVPSDLAGDAEFLRRVTIDVVGTLPTPDEVRAFLADERPDKRSRKIEELLTHPMHAALWATRFCDVTACDVDVLDAPPELRARQAKMWHDWFRKRLGANVPYDQIVHGVLCATSREGRGIEPWIDRERQSAQELKSGFTSNYADRPTLDLFWRRTSGDDFFPLEQMAELTATAFLGVRLECAQCHKHPFDRWTQTDYRAYANIFSRVKFGSSPELTAAMVDLLARRNELPADKKGPPIPRLREVYVTDHRPRVLAHPDTGGPLTPRHPGGAELDESGDAREELFRWMTRPDNPYFARSMVNRVWAHYFGVGLVDPVDNLSAANPPSNGPLLDALAADFVESGYDLRRLERRILNSRTYQLTSTPNESNASDRVNYSHAFARPMLAEVVVDVLNAALGTAEDFGNDAAPGSRAVEVATNRVRSAYVARVFRVFGRPPRQATCDCERPAAPAVPQTLFLMADPVLRKKISGGRLARLVEERHGDAEVVEELFLATLSRLPDADERRAALGRMARVEDRKTAFADILWALINTREFILNH